MQNKPINFRLILVCLVAASMGLPIALISIAKVLLLVGGAIILLSSKTVVATESPKTAWRLTPIAVLVVLLAFTVSLLWTTASQAEAFSSLGKYGKLLTIPLIVVLLRNRAECIFALGVFAIMQTFLVVSSWMLFFHLPVPWAIAHTALSHNVVFSSYVDEGLMAAVFAGICWHLRTLAPGRLGQWIAIGVTVLALCNVFIFDGRSGHVVAIVLVSLAVMWELPKRYRLGVVLFPFVLLLALHAVSSKVQSRVDLLKKEVQTFSFEKGVSVDSGNSSGIRLHFWHRAVQSISEHPLMGSGIGSWSNEFNRLETQQNPAHQNIQPLGNPHQEYLLWGVQLGIPGMALLLALMISILHDTLGMQKMAARAAQSVLVALAVSCLFNSSIYDALIGDFFCVTLGLLLAFGFHAQRDQLGDVGDKQRPAQP